MTLLAAIASDGVLDAAFAWLCKRRRDYPDHADVWEFRRNWPQQKDRIRAELPSGGYRFGLLDRIALANGEEIDLWSARDALVLKALAMVLAGHLPVSRSCTHVKGHGGAKGVVRQVMAKLSFRRGEIEEHIELTYEEPPPVQKPRRRQRKNRDKRPQGQSQGQTPSQTPNQTGTQTQR